MSQEPAKNPGLVAMQKANARRKAAGLPVGRPKGAPNKLTSMIRGGIAATYEKLGGDEAFLEWARSNPEKFYTQLMKLVPKELESNSKGSGITVVVNGTAELRKGTTIDAHPVTPDEPFNDSLEGIGE